MTASSIGIVEKQAVGLFHASLLKRFPWWSSGILWEEVDGAKAEVVSELSRDVLNRMCAFAGVAGCSTVALVFGARRDAPVYTSRDFLGAFLGLVEVPMTAILVGVDRDESGAFALREQFVMVAFRGGQWEVGGRHPEK